MYFQRLEDLRVDNDKTQIEIAEYLNLNRNVYWRYEKGEREIPVWALIKLADYYRVSTDYLLGLTDDPARRFRYRNRHRARVSEPHIRALLQGG